MKQHDQRWESQCMWQDCAKAGEEQQLDMFLSARGKKCSFFKRFFFFASAFPLFETSAPFPCCTRAVLNSGVKLYGTHVCGGGSHDTKTAQWNGRVRVPKEVSQDTVVANIVLLFCHGRFTGRLVIVGGGGGVERAKCGGGAGYATRGAEG